MTVFDLKTATIWKVVQAHAAPVSAAAFDPSCKHLLTYSLLERKWKVWQVRGDSAACIQSRIDPRL